MTENDEDYQYQKERERELQAEKVRQQRIREKAPGMRSKNNRAGEIDGAGLQNYSFRTLSNNQRVLRYHSCPRASQRRLGICY
jgi:hypothetical protein